MGTHCSALGTEGLYPTGGVYFGLTIGT
jgi:hypothetical protein